MIDKLFMQVGGLTICTVITFTGINAVETLSDNRYELGYSDTAIAQTAEEQIARSVYKKASPAVVTVKDGKVHGSGFVVSQDGLIVTNAHVVEGSPSVVTVVFASGKQLPADVIGFAKGGLDLAVLKIHRQKNLSALALATVGSTEVGDGQSPAVGERVFALGTPLKSDYADTFTQGNINRIDRKDGRIQHDAVIQAGNSGGPLLNTKGEVIGVNTSGIGRTNSGTNFAIPVSKLLSFVAAVKKGDLSPVSTLKKPSREPKIATISLNGKDINGKLSKENSFANLYIFQGKAGQKLIVEMTSQTINPFLSLYQLVETARGDRPTLIAENDDKGAGDFNSLITTTLPADGVYVIRAKSATNRQSGDYSLRATANP